MATESKKDKYISKKMSKLKDEGYEGKQRVAIALNMAREKGFDVPEKLVKREAKKKKD